MVALWECDRVTVSDLGARVLLDFGTLTPLLKRLELRGLISRKRNPRDERQIILSVSKMGWAMQKRAADVPGRLRCQITLSRAQTADLRSTLKQIVLDLREDQRHGSALHDQG
jgi:DNA-binding MarR family transcriptional regulator